MAPKPATLEEKAAEEKAFVTQIVEACVRAQLPVCLPKLPGHGRVDVPTVCAGSWGGQLRLGLLMAVNKMRRSSRATVAQDSRDRRLAGQE
eukprot:3586568-Prymnesium_polylepis.1